MSLSLLDSLLAEDSPARQSSQRQRRVEQAPSVKRMILEHRGGSLTLSRVEVEALKKLLETCSNPFVNGDFTTSDFEALGLKVKDSEGQRRQPQGEDDEEGSAGGTKFIPTHMALIAPDFTPSANEPISHEVARRVIKEPEIRQQAKQPFTIDPGDDEVGAGLDEATLMAKVSSMVLNGTPKKQQRGLSEDVPSAVRNKLSRL